MVVEPQGYLNLYIELDLNLTFTINGNQMGIVVNGDAGELSIENEVMPIKTGDGPVTGKFSNKYVTVFSKADKVSKGTRMSLAEGMPIELQYDTGTGTTFTLYIAPQIDDDDAMDST